MLHCRSLAVWLSLALPHLLQRFSIALRASIGSGFGLYPVLYNRKLLIIDKFAIFGKLILKFLSVLVIQIVTIRASTLLETPVLMAVIRFVQVFSKPRPAIVARPRAAAVIALASPAIDLAGITSGAILGHCLSSVQTGKIARGSLGPRACANRVNFSIAYGRAAHAKARVIHTIAVALGIAGKVAELICMPYSPPTG